MGKRTTKSTNGGVIGYKWIGHGRSIATVPTRDLTLEEWDRWGETILATEENTGRKFFEPIVEEPEPQEPEEVIENG